MENLLKNLLKIVLISGFAVALISCGKEDTRQRIGRNARTPHSDNDVMAGPGNSANSTKWGEITDNSEEGFFNAVQYFVSSTIDPTKELGAVSGRPGQKTGVRFWGSVELESPFNGNWFNRNQKIRLSTAQLHISIWDSFVGQKDGSGNVIPEYSIHMKGAASGSVDSLGRVTITFRDDYGSITFQGSQRGSDFTGTVQFDNTRYWDGTTPGATGTLGTFKVSTCGFFRCSQ